METHDAVILLILRWIHFLAGITWIGHLYFFNFVQGSFEKTLDADTKKKVIPQLRPRALWWFRWGAMITMLSGVTYLVWENDLATNAPHWKGWFDADKNWWITMGGLFGLVMWYNVWFIIWPHQKVILNGIATGNKAPDHDARIAAAGKFSRINTYLSVPMLFGMAGRSHSFGMTQGEVGVNVYPMLGTMAVVIAVGLATAWLMIYKVGPAVGKEFAPAPVPAPAPTSPPPPAK